MHSVSNTWHSYNLTPCCIGRCFSLLLVFQPFLDITILTCFAQVGNLLVAVGGEAYDKHAGKDLCSLEGESVIEVIFCSKNVQMCLKCLKCRLLVDANRQLCTEKPLVITQLLQYMQLACGQILVSFKRVI